MEYRGSDIGFLPTSQKEMIEHGIDEFDIIIFTGDAYIDHPSFGAAVIARVIEAEGCSVAVVPQPNWRDDLRDFRKLGAPRLFFAVTAGNMDSMVNHYTAARRRRSDDSYSPGGKAGFRPDYPTIVYTSILKELFPGIPVIAGGIEASMRRFSHYDYWKESVEPSILISSGVDMVVYGMGEAPVRELVRLMLKGVPFSSLKTIPQTVIKVDKSSQLPLKRNWSDLWLDSYDEISRDKRKFARSFMLFEKETSKVDQARIIEEYGGNLIIANPPFPPGSTAELDRIYELPFTCLPHPRYQKKGDIPAYEMIRFSVNIHRGCFGGCSFCAISAHQGKHIVSRSQESVLREISKLAGRSDFKGVITDLGGPSANMYGMKPIEIGHCNKCTRVSCIYPSICNNIETSHGQINRLYDAALGVAGVKNVFIGSGVRYDLLLKESNRRAGDEEERYLRNLITRHVSGRLKVAPEHTDSDVLKLMRKPSFDLFRVLKRRYDRVMSKSGRRGEIVPYLISAHPGCTEGKMADLASVLRELNIRPEQVQEFTPTPMTLSSVIYYTGINPYTGKEVFVPRSREERSVQKRYFFWYRKDDAKFIAARNNKKTGTRLRPGH
jgi:uncharacterized radical SAM protein YgiQ